jgi:hypothetical protein
MRLTPASRGALVTASLVLVAAALALLPAAAAHAKSAVEFTPALSTLLPGDPTQVQLSMITADEHAEDPRAKPAVGVTPVVTLTEFRSGAVVTATGTKANADGVSTVTITLPSAGLWQPKVLTDDGTFAPEPFRVGPAPTPVATRAAATTSTGDSGFPWLPVVVLAAAAVGLLALARRRLGSPPPRAAQ